jgi:hypothetical protein
VSASVLYMSMSLDGYIAGLNDEPGNPGGDGFDRLHEWGATADGVTDGIESAMRRAGDRSGIDTRRPHIHYRVRR